MIKSIMCCCGSGLGSSMLVRMNVEKTLQKIGVSGVSVHILHYQMQQKEQQIYLL